MCGRTFCTCTLQTFWTVCPMNIRDGRAIQQLSFHPVEVPCKLKVFGSQHILESLQVDGPDTGLLFDCLERSSNAAFGWLEPHVVHHLLVHWTHQCLSWGKLLQLHPGSIAYSLCMWGGRIQLLANTNKTWAYGNVEQLTLLMWTLQTEELDSAERIFTPVSWLLIRTVCKGCPDEVDFVSLSVELQAWRCVGEMIKLSNSDRGLGKRPRNGVSLQVI